MNRVRLGYLGIECCLEIDRKLRNGPLYLYRYSTRRIDCRGKKKIQHDIYALRKSNSSTMSPQIPTSKTRHFPK